VASDRTSHPHHCCLNPEKSGITPWLIVPPAEPGFSLRLCGQKAEKYIRFTGTSRAAATRELQNLVEKGARLLRGELRHTRHFLAILEQIRTN
jgi:hypothetical protein